jgi:hypothetical protein
MKRAAFFFSVMMTSASAAFAASAAVPPGIEGRSCTVDDRGSATWYGFFKGKRDVFSPLKGSNNAKTITRWRCFDAEVECASWKTLMQSDFPEAGNEVFCRQGG